MEFTVNYFDLGMHKGQEIDLFIKEIEPNNKFSRINIYGIEAHPDIFKETILKYKDDLKDLQTEMKVEEDLKCKSDIENGVAQLYTCLKDYDGLGLTLKSGSNYYIHYDDVKDRYVPKGSEEDIPDFVKEYASNLKQLVSLYLDNGIGTLKYRSLFLEVDFENYFKKADLTQVV